MLESHTNTKKFFLISELLWCFVYVKVMTVLLMLLQLVAGVVRESEPIAVDNTVPQAFDSALALFGLHDETERRRLHEVIGEGSENMLKAVIDYENSLSSDERGNVSAQTDIIGMPCSLLMS